jgi:hypothetical protein
MMAYVPLLQRKVNLRRYSGLTTTEFADPGASLSRPGDVDATLLSARNGLRGEWHLAYHELMQLDLQARVVYVDAYNVP